LRFSPSLLNRVPVIDECNEGAEERLRADKPDWTVRVKITMEYWVDVVLFLLLRQEGAEMWEGEAGAPPRGLPQSGEQAELAGSCSASNPPAFSSAP
jgi:hypothetical protein